MIVRETEAEAKAAARRLVSELDPTTGEFIKGRSLDTQSAGVGRQNTLRESADDEGYAEPCLWTGVGRARSGAGAALVGAPDQLVEKLEEYRQVGVDAFILSGYPHMVECGLVAEHMLPRITHAPMKPEF